MFKITWREVFDAKRAGEQIGDTEKNAVQTGYAFYCHNGRIFGKVIISGYDVPDKKVFAQLDFITAEDLD